MSTLHFLDQQRIFHSIQQLCQVLGVVPSRYYAWRHMQGNGAVDPQEPAWKTKMVAIFDPHKRPMARVGSKSSCGKRVTG